MAKQERMYYRVRGGYVDGSGINSAEIEIMINPWFYGQEDLRMDFGRGSTLTIHLQQMRDDAPYWYVTRYSFEEDVRPQYWAKFTKLAQEVRASIEEREGWVKEGRMSPDRQLDFTHLNMVEVEYNGPYYYPVEFAPTKENPLFKWIMLIDPKDVKGRNKPKATHVYKGKEVTYLGFVYANDALQASERISRRLMHYENRKDLWDAYAKFNPFPVPKFEAYPEMKRVEA